MRRRLESVTDIGRRIGISDDKGYLAPVLIALVIVAAIVAGFYVYYIYVIHPEPEPYNNISILDAQKQAVNYPDVLIANHNSTFSVYVNVENHMNKEQTYQVQTKITKNLPANFPNGLQATPVNTYDFSLASDVTNQQLVTVTENTVGNYAVVFELWQMDNSGTYVFTNDYCVLNIEVIN